MSKTNRKSNRKSDDKSSLTVLIVDDDRAQLESLSRGMLLYGHYCIKTKSISSAIDYLKKPDGTRVDLLLTDATLQGSDGIHLIEHIRALFPRLPVVAVSGLKSNLDSETKPKGEVRIIRRPFNPSDLEETIRDMVA